MAPEKPLTPRPDERWAIAGSDGGARGMLKRALSRAYWAILWERLWPALATVLTAVGFFIAVSWTGLWLILPPLARAVVLFGLLLLIAISAVPLFRFRLPREADGLRPRPLAQRANAHWRGQPRERLDQLGHLGTGNPEVAMATVALDPEQSPGDELREVAAGG